MKHNSGAHGVNAALPVASRFDDFGKASRVQAGSADQRAVDVG